MLQRPPPGFLGGAPLRIAIIGDGIAGVSVVSHLATREQAATLSEPGSVPDGNGDGTFAGGDLRDIAGCHFLGTGAHA